MMESPRSRSYKVHVAVAALLLLHIALTADILQQKSATSDEPPHIAAGYSYITERDFRYNPEHPPLIKEIAAFPLLFLNVSLEQGIAWEQVYEWPAGRNFLFENSEDPDTILFWARMPMVLLSALLGFVVFLFARRWYGNSAGIFALFLYAFSPLVLGNAWIVQTDVAAALALAASLYCFWLVLQQPSWKRIVVLGIVLGLSLASKFTAAFILGIMVLLLIIYLIWFWQRIVWKRNLVLLVVGKGIVMLFIAWLILAASYGFTFSTFFNTSLKTKLATEAIPGMHPSLEGIAAATLIPVPLPEQYVQGLYQVIRQSKTGYPAYLLGEVKSGGWWQYFPLAFLIKTPIAFLIMLTLAFWHTRTLVKSWFRELFILLPATLIFLSFMAGQLNIGIRHILPVYPLLFIFASKLINYRRWMTVFVITLSIWYAAATLIIHPHELAYFNELVGPEHGPDFLIDSNIDWGQDLKGLAAYLGEHNITEQIWLMYWGPDRMEYRSSQFVKYRRILDENMVCKPVSGYIAVSVNFLKGMTKEEQHCFDWLKGEEPMKRIGYSIYLYRTD
ncbi:glycosyltransferase family 39 protein [Candidatus Woesearchaeota archaeon]|nr:glycosyltransferase family 39 protein [Candidatus Woesearchaeota archaeon]